MGLGYRVAAESPVTPRVNTPVRGLSYWSAEPLRLRAYETAPERARMAAATKAATTTRMVASLDSFASAAITKAKTILRKSMRFLD